MHQSRLLAPLAALTAVGLCGCPDSGNVDEDFAVPTSIAVDPAGFLGGVPCSNQPGAMRSYVATAVDRTDPQSAFTLPSSPATPCSQRVQFRYVIPGHVYTADVDGYEELAVDLAPLGGDGSGSRKQVAASLPEGPVVPPRWTTRCKEATAVEGAPIPVGACDPLEDQGMPGATAIAVDPAGALGKLGCTATGGEIERFDVIPQGAGLPPVLGVACPPGAPIVYSAGIVPGQAYAFRIEAQGADPLTTYVASCNAVAKEGLTITATCDPLASTGALTIPIETILEAATPVLSCGAGSAVMYVASLTTTADPATEIASAAVPCAERARFSPLPPGSYTAKVNVRGADGATLTSATCTGDVVAGVATVVTCP